MFLHGNTKVRMALRHADQTRTQQSQATLPVDCHVAVALRHRIKDDT